MWNGGSSLSSSDMNEIECTIPGDSRVCVYFIGMQQVTDSCRRVHLTFHSIRVLS